MTKVVMASLSGRGDKSTLRMTKVVMASLSGRGDTRSFANAQEDKSTLRRTSLRTGGQVYAQEDKPSFGMTEGSGYVVSIARSRVVTYSFVEVLLIVFTCWVLCSWLGCSPMPVKQQILLLARLAFYCGIGYKTAMGMGQVRTI